MKYAIPNSNIKVFIKGLHSLGKIGDEVFFEAGENSALHVKALNSSKTAYFVYTFLSNFFTAVEVDHKSNISEEPLRCKVHLRSLEMAFPNLAHAVKTVESCLIQFSRESCKLVVTKVCRNGVTMENTLPMMEHDKLKVEYSQSGSSHWQLNSRALSDVISAFLPSHDEAVMTVTPERFHIKNFVESSEDKEQTHTDFSLYPVEFDEYSIMENTSFVFSLREFRSIIGFAEATVLPVKATFSTGGKPITFSIRQEPVIEVSYSLATMQDTDDATLQRVVNTPQPTGMRSRNRSNESNASMNQQRHSTQTNINVSVMPPPSLTPIPEPTGSRLLPPPPEVNTSSNKSFQGGNGDVGIADSPTFAVLKPRPRPKVFSKCFDATVDPARLAGKRILAEDSDPEEQE